MNIIQLYGHDCAPQAQGHVVVIDVIRAFSTTAYILANGAEQIILVGKPEEAFELKKTYADALLVGEIDGKQIKGFDYGNSPADMANLDTTGRLVILRSSAGTQGVVKACNAKKILAGSLVTALATVRYLKIMMPETVTLLATMSNGKEGDEDRACSDYIKDLLQDKKVNKNKILKRVKESPAGQRALDTKIDWVSPQDLELASKIDRFGFAIEVNKENGLFVASKL
ncbi:2-phosphosulfolactate phosphatase [Elusimicrobiota bacterium]